MTITSDIDSVRQLALDYLWMHNADWTTMAETGGPPIMVSGDGVRVTDAEGNIWIDAHGGVRIRQCWLWTRCDSRRHARPNAATDLLPAGHHHSPIDSPRGEVRGTRPRRA